MRDKKFYRLNKRCITLLELVIAVSLTLIVLSTLTYFYRQVSLIGAEMNRTQGVSFQKRFIENRLAEILPKTLSSKDPSNDFHFFTSPDLGGLFKNRAPSLVFSFDNGVQINKDMSYHVIGRIYLDYDGNLTLAKWPVEKRWKEFEEVPMTKEVLLENVEDLAFSFFIPPVKGTQTQPQEGGAQSTTSPTTSGITEDLRGQWVPEWLKEYRQLPAIVKIFVKRKDEKGENETLIYAFPLPNSQYPIIYEG